MPAVHPSFQCVVISPLGKLLDCQTISVVLPAHDGEVGVWHNHIPMLCKLGMGIMKIIGVPLDVDTPPEMIFLLIDGGSALLAENVLTIITFDAISFRDTESEKIQRIIERTEKSAAKAATPQQRSHYLKKRSLLAQLSRLEHRQEAVETAGKESHE